MNLQTKVALNNGIEIPWVGLGVFQSTPGEETKNAVRWALDLYLVHWPVKGKYKDTWKALEKLYADGKVRAIGVSNFLPQITCTDTDPLGPRARCSDDPQIRSSRTNRGEHAGIRFFARRRRYRVTQKARCGRANRTSPGQYLAARNRLNDRTSK